MPSKASRTFRLGDIADQIGGELVGNADLPITRIGPLEGATPSTISFLAHPKYQAQLALSHAACVIVGPAMRDAAVARGAALIAVDAYLTFARLTQWWAAQTRPPPAVSVHPSAVIDATARLGERVSIGPLAVIEAGAVIEDGAVIDPDVSVILAQHSGCTEKVAL